MAKKIIIGITQGDTNGIGYEVIIKALADNRILELFTPVVYGSGKFWGQYRKMINSVESYNYNSINSINEVNPKMVNLLQCVPDNLTIDPGVISADAAQAASIALETAVKDLREEKIQAIVTAPFNKHSMNDKGFSFPGHTEYLANAFGTKNSLMLLCSSKMRIGVVTAHLPLSKVSETLSPELILDKLRVMVMSLFTDFSIRQPKIAVLGLNPHAGEEGLLGKEEQTIIAPAIERANQEGILAFGPFPPDSFFARQDFGRFDAILAMYHDQGLIPFKTLSFADGVNYTAGLPFIRTSPDHGTAYDIAGKDRADAQSILSAMYLACDIYRHRQQNAELTSNPLRSIRFDNGKGE